MKSLVTLLIPTLFACSAFANNGLDLQGQDAANLLNALTGAGGYVDCGAGTCGTSASQISCSRVKFQDNSSSCTLKLEDNTGGETQKQLTGASADALIESLIDAGVVGCGMESCQGSAQSIDCTFANDPNAGVESNHCSIN